MAPRGSLLTAPRSQSFTADPTWREAQKSLCVRDDWCTRGLSKEGWCREA
ncbi:unnamed protein product [Gulo gulo]|uniref:Uncharacterized protein n=1 Tax=Gulo gulo TaxID=48420 RepID=A0A9X9MED2_GULGU|nr:unnamed protein product [Gulo gulo]